MGPRHVIGALGARLVEVERQVHAQRHVPQRLGEAQVRRRVVDRVSAEDEQGLNLSAGHAGGQVLDRARLRHRILHVSDCGALVCQGLVNPHAQGLHPGGEVAAPGEQAAGARRL